MEFTKDELMNLLVFMQRTQLVGKEVEAYNIIYNKIINALNDNKE